MASLLAFMPLRVVTPDKINKILLGLYMSEACEIIDIPVAYLTAVFHVQSLLQQHSIWPQNARFLVAKH